MDKAEGLADQGAKDVRPGIRRRAGAGARDHAERRAAGGLERGQADTDPNRVQRTGSGDLRGLEYYPGKTGRKREPVIQGKMTKNTGTMARIHAMVSWPNCIKRR